MSETIDLGAANHFTVGTIGEPGQRVFMIQINGDRRGITLKCEKQQVASLGRYLADMVEDMGRPGHLPDDLDLIEPVELEWAVGSIAVSLDDDNQRLVIVLSEAGDFDEEFGDSASIVTFTITREQAAAVAIRSTALVEAGRPPCPLCGFPLDTNRPNDHACPRTNGNRPPEL